VGRVFFWRIVTEPVGEEEKVEGRPTITLESRFKARLCFRFGQGRVGRSSRAGYNWP
jgi:hypothetical protein